MKVLTNPTYRADDGSIHTTPEKAAERDTYTFFRELLRGEGFKDDDVAALLAARWESITESLVSIKSDYNNAKYPVAPQVDQFVVTG